MSDEAGFIHVDKHESFLKIDTVILMGTPKHSRKTALPKIASSQCLYIISKKESEMNLIFGMQINIKVSCNLVLTLGALKFTKR